MLVNLLTNVTMDLHDGTQRAIDRAIDALEAGGGPFSTPELASRLGISRQAAHRHVRSRLDDGRLVAEGNTRSRRYRTTRYVSRSAPVDLVREPRTEHPTHWSRRFALVGLREDEAWKEMRALVPALALPGHQNVDNVLNYVVSELVNNSIDHSRGTWVEVELALERIEGVLSFRGRTLDDGIGAFESVRRAGGLPDALDALLELSKGKLTTLPEAHSGEGLFFSSRAVDHFEVEANGLCWTIDGVREDQAVREVETRSGTRVSFALRSDTTRALAETFERYTTDFAFDRTRCLVRLFRHGVTFVSRSEAKRVARRLERFREVEIDFKGVEMVGQGFVDELFRVWASQHPGVRLVPSNMSRAVEFMVRRGLPPFTSP